MYSTYPTLSLLRYREMSAFQLFKKKPEQNWVELLYLTYLRLIYSN